MTMPGRLGAALLATWTGLLAACSSPGPGADDDDVPPDDGRPRVDAVGTGTDAGIDGGPSQLSVYESGTRLKMRVGTSPDGAKTFLGWRDTMRNEDCAFQLAGDGQQRCLPAGAANYAEGLFWGDSGCATTRLAYTTVGCAATGHVQRYEQATCTTYRWRIHALGPRHLGTVYVKSGASCTVNTSAYDFYVLGAEVPPGSFVGLTESLE
jgi:hypothetical protein